LGFITTDCVPSKYTLLFEEAYQPVVADAVAVIGITPIQVNASASVIAQAALSVGATNVVVNNHNCKSTAVVVVLSAIVIVLIIPVLDLSFTANGKNCGVIDVPI